MLQMRMIQDYLNHLRVIVPGYTLDGHKLRPLPRGEEQFPGRVDQDWNVTRE